MEGCCLRAETESSEQLTRDLRTHPAIDDAAKLLEFPGRWRKVFLTFELWFVDVERKERFVVVDSRTF